MTQTSTTDIGQCWYCKKDTVNKLIDPVDDVPHLSNSPVLICTSCGLIYKKPYISDHEFANKLKSSYYGSFDKESLLIRSKARALVDKSRALEYINFIIQHIIISLIILI